MLQRNYNVLQYVYHQSILDTENVAPLRYTDPPIQIYPRKIRQRRRIFFLSGKKTDVKIKNGGTSEFWIIVDDDQYSI
jgi:hypothetical protein